MLKPVNRMYCQRVLPAVFDDSISYYEAICKLVKAINDAYTYVDNAINDFTDTSKQYTDDAIAAAFNQFELEAAALRKSFAEFTERTNLEIYRINSKVTQQDANIAAGLAAISSSVALAIEENNQLIFDQIASQLIDIRVINYFTGEKVTVQDMFDYLAQYHLTNSITYNQLAQREKTYNQLAALGISYTELVANGGNLIQ